jgi:enhancing lycopene biosynthesis protein 2
MKHGKIIVSDELSDINENLGAVTYIMLGRIYDMLVLIADSIGKGEDALQLIQLHGQGQLMCPPPSLVIDEENGGGDG